MTKEAGVLTGNRAARVVLSALAVPGDRLIGDAIDSIGAEEALERLWLRGSDEQRRLSQMMGVDTRDLHDFLNRYPVGPTEDWRNRLLAHVSATQCDVLIPGDAHWPHRLFDLGPYAPVVLFARGNPGVLNAAATLGVVGTRHPSAGGVEACARVAREALQVGYTLVSGGARGIDWVAHVTAWNSGAPQVMVLATPLDRPTTWQARALGRVVEYGAVVTETPPGRPITPTHFLHRNRVIAALSDRVVVVEAAERSGSLNTASHAKKLGRDLSAMVWRGRDEKNAGCYRLIEEWGADRYSPGHGPDPKHP